MTQISLPSPAPSAWTPRRRRLLLAVAALLLAGIAVWLVLRAFSDNLNYYFTPTQVAEGQAQGKDKVRIGGMVQQGSINRQPGQVRFVLTDMAHTVPVLYRSDVLPDLFAEGKGATVTGQLDAQGQLLATEVLAKHDENYAPPGMAQPPASSP
jgi:cytochrome c-type biogenesis protein CcmE